jgi:guanine deaminase
VAAAQPGRATVIRAKVMHVPRDPFRDGGTLECHENGAVAFRDGRIVATGDVTEVTSEHPEAELLDERDAFLLPGFVDTHVHWAQLGVIGAMGLELLEWLSTRTLPEEAKQADLDYARPLARDFVRALAANGTTSALVFGSHLPGAQEVFFEAAAASGLRIASGLAVSDRDLLPELLTTPEEGYDAGLALARRWHGKGRLRYAVTPRFSVSCTDEMLESCGALADAVDGALVTSHLNESRPEVERVLERFDGAADYLETYERHGLVGAATVLAHSVHSTDAELARMAAAGACAAHCPSSNGFLGSGVFPMRRHLAHRVRFALGTDVGAGSGLSLLKECVTAYQSQMLTPAGVRMSPAELLWLATRAGAEALGLADEAGDLTPGRSADMVLLRAPEESTLAATLARSETGEQALGALMALAREDAVAAIWVAGEPVHRRR